MKRFICAVLQPLLYAPILSAQFVEYETISRDEFAMHQRWLGLDSQHDEIYNRLIDDYQTGVVQVDRALALIRKWNRRLADEGIDRRDADPVQPYVTSDQVVDLYMQSRNAAQREVMHLESRYVDSLWQHFPERDSDIRSIEYRRTRARMLTSRVATIRYVPDVLVLLDRTAPEVRSNADARSIIGRYERELDVRIQQRQRGELTDDDWLRLVRNRDDAGLLDAYAASWLNTMHIRNLSRHTVNALRPFMADEAFQKFEREFMAAFYPPRPDSRPDALVRWLVDQPGLTEQERARIDEIRRQLDRSFDAAMPTLRRQYDAFFTRGGILAYAEEFVNANREHRRPSTMGPDEDWRTQWAPKEMSAVPDDIAHEVDEINHALSQRVDVLANSAAPDQRAEERTHVLWMPALDHNEMRNVMSLFDLDEPTRDLVEQIDRQFQHVFTMESRRNRLALTAIYHEARRRFTDPAQVQQWAVRQNADSQRDWFDFRASYESQFRDEIAMFLNDADRQLWIDLHTTAFVRGLLQHAKGLIARPHLFDVALALEAAGLIPRDEAEGPLSDASRTYREELLAEVSVLLNAAIDQSVKDHQLMTQVPVDKDRMRLAVARMRALGDPIEQLNRRWTERFTQLLPGFETEIQQAIRTARYSGVYRLSPAERAFALLDAVDELDAHLRDRLSGLCERFNHEHALLRDALVRAIRQYEQSDRSRREAAHDAVIKLTLQQQQLVEQACRDIRSAFPPDVFDALRSDIRVLVSWM